MDLYTILEHNTLAYTHATYIYTLANMHIYSTLNLAAQGDNDSILNLSTLLKLDFCVPLSMHDCLASTKKYSHSLSHLTGFLYKYEFSFGKGLHIHR